MSRSEYLGIMLVFIILLIPSATSAAVHPYLLFHDISDVPGYQYRTEEPWNGWETGIIRSAETSLKKDFANDSGANNRIIYRAGSARTLGLAYQITKEQAYAEKARDALFSLDSGDPSTKTDRAASLGSFSLAYDWIQPTLDPEEDTIIRDKLATLADTVYKDLNDDGKKTGYISFVDYHGQAYPNMGIVSAALADYENPDKLSLSSKPADWNRAGTEYLFENDKLHKYNRSMFSFGFDESSGKNFLGAYKSYVMDDMVTWFQVYSHTNDQNIFEKYPAAKRAFTSEIWESMPNQVSNNYVTNGNVGWAYHKAIISLLPDSEKPPVLNHIDRVSKSKILPYSNVWGGSSTGGISSTLLYCVYGNYNSVPRTFPETTSHLDRTSIYQVFRENWDDDADWLSLITFNAETNSNRDMAHQDQLSIEYYSHGDLLLADAGEPKHILGGSYGTTEISHNSIAIEDPRNPFPVSSWSGSSSQGIFKGNAQGIGTPVEVSTIIQLPWVQLIQARASVTKVINGKSSADFRTLSSPLSYERTILYPDSDYFVIIDRMEGTQEWVYRNIFRPSTLMVTPTADINKDGRYQPSELGHVNGDLIIGTTPYDWRDLDFKAETPTGIFTNSLTWTTKNPYGKDVTLNLFSSPSSEILIEKNGGRIGGYDAKSEIATPVIYLRPPAASEVYRVTVLLSRYSTEDTMKADEISVTGMGHAVKVASAQASDVIYAGNGQSSFDAFTTDADIAFIRQQNENVQVILIGGSSLMYKNEPWIMLSEKTAAVALKRENGMTECFIQGEPDLQGNIFQKPVDKSQIEKPPGVMEPQQKQVPGANHIIPDESEDFLVYIVNQVKGLLSSSALVTPSG